MCINAMIARIIYRTRIGPNSFFFFLKEDLQLCGLLRFIDDQSIYVLLWGWFYFNPSIVKIEKNLKLAWLKN